MTLNAHCDPDCANLNFSLGSETLPSWLTIGLPASIPCDGVTHQLPVSVLVGAGAPFGPVTFTINGAGPAMECSTQATVTVGRADLEFADLAESVEQSPGGLIVVNNDDDDLSARADKDDDGAVDDEDDLKPLEIKLEGLSANGSGILQLLQGAGGQVRVYLNADRSDGGIELPVSIDGINLPLTLWVEGVHASNAARDVSFHLDYQPQGAVLCSDMVNVSVGGIEFIDTSEFTGAVHRNMDLIKLNNPSPLLELSNNFIPFYVAPVDATISGQVTNHIAPLTTADVTINDQSVEDLQLISSGPSGLGPFVQSFSSIVTFPDHDLLIKGKATDALGNVGWDKRVTIASYLCNPPIECPGTFLSRADRAEPSTPIGTSTADSFSVVVVDPFATGPTIGVFIQTGVETRTLTLARVGNSIRFLIDGLLLVPENLSLPNGTPQAIVNTRLMGRLGKRVRASCALSAGPPCEDNALTVGLMFVAAGTGEPVVAALAGVPKDVLDGGTNRQPLRIMAGLPGDASMVSQNGSNYWVPVKLVTRDYRDDPNGLTHQSWFNLIRASNAADSPDYNLFQLDSASPLLPIASDATAISQNPFGLLLHDVYSGGFLRAELEGKNSFGALQAVEPVHGPIVVNVLVDGLGAGFPQASFAPVVPPNFQTMLEAGKLPNFAKLVGDTAHSVRRWDAQTTFPSITFSAWASWVTGKDPGQHGVTGSNFYRRHLV